MRYIIGPELFWLLAYCAAALIARANRLQPTKEMDRLIENMWVYLPLLSLLVFALWLAPGVEKRYLLTRVWIAGLIGGHLALERVLRGYSEQGPGIGMAYIVGMGFLVMLLVAGSVYVKIRTGS